ncbi:hypothetical protein Lal_00015883 [Lupinus albus]|nr:hypothetical protein Lal_00015883 [Lupinus albus]
MAWEWNHMKDPNNKKSVTCNFYGHTSTGGITRAKKRQMGVIGDVTPTVDYMVESHFGRRMLEAPVRRLNQMEVSPISRGKGRPRKTIDKTIRKDLENNAL